MSRDVIADFLTIIRNSIVRSKPFVVCDFSKIRHEMAIILKNEGFIVDVAVIEETNSFKKLKLILKYVDGESVIHEITRISKPSLRVYKNIDNIKPVISGLGISILTTNRGLMTDKVAKHQRVGGELICTVW